MTAWLKAWNLWRMLKQLKKKKKYGTWKMRSGPCLVLTHKKCSDIQLKNILMKQSYAFILGEQCRKEVPSVKAKPLLSLCSLSWCVLALRLVFLTHFWCEAEEHIQHWSTNKEEFYSFSQCWVWKRRCSKRCQTVTVVTPLLAFMLQYLLVFTFNVEWLTHPVPST